MEYIVQTTAGKVQGFLKDGVVNFLGIPYAQPPVGALRYKRAVPMEPWSGVFQADHYGDKSVQWNQDHGEGCQR